MAEEEKKRIGRYDLIERVACGGTAEVWRALLTGCVGFKKTVAIKRLLPAKKQSEELRAMLIDEAKVLTNLHHRSVVQVFELCEEKSEPFIAMELVEGVDCSLLLSRIMRDGSAQRIDIALFIVAEALEALVFAHRKTSPEGNPIGIVHRDISPSNILLSWSGEVKLIDFGIAKGAHRAVSTMAGSLRGKLSYMSPEQASGVEVDARSDVYSMGVVLAELLLARKLFEAQSDAELLEVVRHPPPLPEAAVKLSPCIRAILLSALSPRLSLRFQSASEMLTAVRHAQQKLKLQATSIELCAYLRDVFRDKFARADGRGLSEDTGDFSADQIPKTEFMGEVSHRTDSRPKLGGALICAAKLFAMTAIGASLAIVPPNRENSASAGGNPPSTSGVQTMVVPKEVGSKAIELAAKRMSLYKAVKKNTSDAPHRSAEKKACVSVTARPWGIASVEGLKAKAETPTKICGPVGTYVLNVSQPSTKKTVSQKIVLSGAKEVFCKASFDKSPKITCR